MSQRIVELNLTNFTSDGTNTNLMNAAYVSFINTDHADPALRTVTEELGVSNINDTDTLAQWQSKRRARYRARWTEIYGTTAPTSVQLIQHVNVTS